MKFFFCYANYTFLLFWMLVFGDGCEAPGIYFGYWDRVAELHQSWLSGIDLVFLIFVIIVELLQWLFIWTMVSRVHFNLVLKDKNGEKWRELMNCFFAHMKTGFWCCSSCVPCCSWCRNSICLCHQLQVTCCC
jgi:hypothetical protein